MPLTRDLIVAVITDTGGTGGKGVVKEKKKVDEKEKVNVDEKEKEKVDEKEEVKEDYLWVGHQQQKCHILLHRGHSNM